jgi:TonB-dependent receptor-like protein
VVATLFSLLPLLAVSGLVETGGTVPTPDSTSSPPRIVRQFPAVEVRALLHDLRSSETVHEIAATALRAYPVDGLAEIVALQAGVVAQGEELHVRGGRAGETLVTLDGLTLNEPLRHRPLELPMLALRSVELVSGAPESRYPGSLAGILDLHTVDPDEHLSGEWRWQTDGGLDTRYDRLGARVSTPLPLLGLGIVVAGDAALDNTWLPALRTPERHRVAGLSLGWRAENRMLGYLKLAPVRSPQGFSLQVLASHKVHEPYDPMWSLDGWVGADSNGVIGIRPEPQPGYTRYRAADHLAITDDRQLASLLTLSVVRGARRATLGLGWLRTRTATTVGGVHEIGASVGGVVFNRDATGDPFHVYAGDDPLARVSGSDVIAVRGDLEQTIGTETAVRMGVGLDDRDLWLDELDLALAGAPLDLFRTYHAYAPGGFAYAQGRWQSGGLVLNGGLRVEYYTAGPQAAAQTLPGSTGGTVSFSPRLGIAYPLTARDVFSMSYTRAQQEPDRDLLYDQRVTISNRQPLGNAALQPAVLISYEAAVKHLISASSAFQSSFFYRDLARVAGARNYQIPGGPVDLRYSDEDQASSAGFELSLVHAPDATRRIEVHYAFMHAWGYESRPEGDPYGPVRDVRTAPIGEQPLSWDRRHSILVAGAWEWRHGLSLAWSSVVGSALPWTPKPRRQVLADVTVINSRRFQWTEMSNANVRWSPPYALGLTFGYEVRNLFGTRGEHAATVDGYPNPIVNTAFDDYGAYRTETGLSGGAYWTNGGATPGWIPVHDPRLFNPPRAMRVSVGRRW